MKRQGIKTVDFKLNVPQARFMTVQANESWLLMARGTGKTTGCTAPWTLHKVRYMPGSCGALVGQSFSDIESKILKPLFLGYQMMGHEMDFHFVYGKKPPEHWRRPLIPIIDYSHVISFPNGTTIQLVSLHQKGSANSNSFQWVFGPEAKYFNELQLRGEVFPTLRGLVDHFGSSPWYGAKMFESDKLSPNIHWLLEKKQLHNEELVSSIIYYQACVSRLLELKSASSERQWARYKHMLKRYNLILTGLRKQCVYFGEANALDNIENLSADYIENMRRSLTDFEFRIAIMNEDPNRVEDGFYPDRTEAHLFDTNNAEDITMPLGIAMDYQASITPLVAFQVNNLLLPDGKTSLNFLHSMYVKKPEGKKEVIDKFCKHYEWRPDKTVYYFYDHTANAEKNNALKDYEDVVYYFTQNGWKCIAIYMGQAPSHAAKYELIRTVLREDKEEYMPVRIHTHNCASMVLSMDLTPLKLSSFTEKDKGSEKRNIPQEMATHQGDVFDQIIWAVYQMDLYPKSQNVPMRLGFRV